MTGGINAWNGLVAEGGPESGMATFSAATSPEELIALAWFLEGGSRRFYSELSVLMKDRDAQGLFKELMKAEESHQATLMEQYGEISKKTPDVNALTSLISPEEDTMEGGIPVREAISWVRGKQLSGVLELCLALEANAYDLHLKMGDRVKDEGSRQVFRVLAVEEKAHLEQLSSLLEKKLEK
jgi:rubrerythrin